MQVWVVQWKGNVITRMFRSMCFHRILPSRVLLSLTNNLTLEDNLAECHCVSGHVMALYKVSVGNPN